MKKLFLLFGLLVSALNLSAENKFYINVQIAVGNLKEKHTQNMFQFVQESFKTRKTQKLPKKMKKN